MKLNWKQLTLLLALSGTIWACGDSEAKKEDSKEVAEEQNDKKFDDKKSEKDAEFVVDALSSNMAEVKLAELAWQKSANKDVKDLAGMLQKDHNAMVTELKTLAGQKAISVPADEGQDTKDKVADLSKKSGKEFDKDIAGVLKDKHESTIKKYENALNDVTDPEIKNWINSALPRVKSHLEMVTAVNDKLNK